MAGGAGELATDGLQVGAVEDDAVDVGAVHAYLTQSYWSPGVSRETVARSLHHSLPFSLLTKYGAQIGFARVVSDRATYAYLADVYVLEAHRGRGLGVWLVECVRAHPELQGLRRWALLTDDAHGLYARFGFAALAEARRHMELVAAP